MKVSNIRLILSSNEVVPAVNEGTSSSELWYGPNTLDPSPHAIAPPARLTPICRYGRIRQNYEDCRSLSQVAADQTIADLIVPCGWQSTTPQKASPIVLPGNCSGGSAGCLPQPAADPRSAAPVAGCGSTAPALLAPLHRQGRHCALFDRRKGHARSEAGGLS